MPTWLQAVLAAVTGSGAVTIALHFILPKATPVVVTDTTKLIDKGAEALEITPIVSGSPVAKALVEDLRSDMDDLATSGITKAAATLGADGFDLAKLLPDLTADMVATWKATATPAELQKYTQALGALGSAGLTSLLTHHATAAVGRVAASGNVAAITSALAAKLTPAPKPAAA